MRVLLTGASGQLGQALQASVPSLLGDQSIELLATSRRELDLADADACRELVRQVRPDWVLNAGAYTSVDQAEQQPELANAVNHLAPVALAEAVAELSGDCGRFLQLSTDFVFSGEQAVPYPPDASVAPLGVYGATKAAAERAVMGRLPHGQRAFVLRTSWAYGPVGHNFCRTMLRLHRERTLAGHSIHVVSDQLGCPTSTSGLAAACWRLISLVNQGACLPPVMHWSDAGIASWYDFALAIGKLGVASGLLEKAAPIYPITTADYPTLARRPSYSLLDCTTSRVALGMQPQHWRVALQHVLENMRCTEQSPHTLAGSA
ncbi:MAG: dTDP-4-dehydrorhamnose reductase [Cyanobacteria bacterium K_Offshore_0m_m2_072]|nr:dTDP-4-dehydrorhamnose reductase [Cyanobacteria bacterium K_Offshore_0m_m2_072]